MLWIVPFSPIATWPPLKANPLTDMRVEIVIWDRESGAQLCIDPPTFGSCQVLQMLLNLE